MISEVDPYQTLHADNTGYIFSSGHETFIKIKY